MDQFSEVENIRERINGRYISEGQYRFRVNGKMVYALWGTDGAPDEIKGKVKVTDTFYSRLKSFNKMA
ncbi:MAG: hypothetical protein QME54_02445 [Actinomycetota bacterium]|nr:hypothetical protein [Actinomycetota bacterium]